MAFRKMRKPFELFDYKVLCSSHTLREVKACVYLCLALALLLQTIKASKPNPLTGKLFLLTVPMMLSPKGKCFLYIYTFYEEDIIVKVKLPRTQSTSPILMNVTVYKFHVAVFQVDSKYNPSKTMGYLQTIHLFSDRDFGVYAFLYDFEDSVASLQLLPVSAWGKQYFLATMSYTPFVQMITYEEVNIIDLTIRTSLYQLRKSLHRFGVDKIHLYRDGAYVLSDCRVTDKEHGSVTGSSAVGKFPFAVISGSCSSRTNITTCGHVNSYYGDTYDAVAEMLQPLKLYGTEFISPAVVGRMSKWDIMIVASADDTIVTVYASGVNEYILHTGLWVYVVEASSSSPVYLRSSHPVQVLLLQRSACHKSDENAGGVGELGDPAMSILVPTSLFYHTYIWKAPDKTLLPFINYIAMVSADTYYRDILVDRSPAYKFLQIQEVLGRADWKVLAGKLADEEHVISSSRLKVFGCYFYGLGQKYAYMQPGGFLSDHDDVSCKDRKGHAVDDIDNDCDGKVNEESMNSKDDDMDGLIDEDCSLKDQRNGYWGFWSEWSCSRNCTDEKVYRQRLCDRPVPNVYGKQCLGVGSDSLPGDCFKDTICPENCPWRTYGKNCLGQCPNCLSDCDRFTGACTECADGWQDNDHGCTTECSYGAYGRLCNFSCFAKCGSDCLERVTGQCAEKGKPIDLLFLLILLLVSPVCFLQCCIKGQV
ncbi:properdin [Biomphalaria glabrata]|nr:properdin [Biomphalaria glabrata]